MRLRDWNIWSCITSGFRKLHKVSKRNWFHMIRWMRLVWFQSYQNRILKRNVSYSLANRLQIWQIRSLKLIDRMWKFSKELSMRAKLTLKVEKVSWVAFKERILELAAKEMLSCELNQERCRRLHLETRN